MVDGELMVPLLVVLIGALMLRERLREKERGGVRGEHFR